MSRYIDAEIIKLLMKQDRLLQGNCEYELWKQEVDRQVNALPSIDIVRCSECKHWNEEDHWCNIRDSYGWDYKADDYCSYGVKKGADDERSNNESAVIFR